MLVKLGHKRNFVIVEAGGPASYRQLRIWRWKDRLVIFCTVVYSACAFLFTAVFLANVTAHDGRRWLVAVVIGFVKKAVLMPLLFSVILFVAGASLTLCMASVRLMAHDALDPEASKERQEEEVGPLGGQPPEEEPRIEPAGPDEASMCSVAKVAHEAAPSGWRPGPPFVLACLSTPVAPGKIPGQNFRQILKQIDVELSQAQASAG